MRKPFSLRSCLLAAIALTAFCVPSWTQANIRTVLFVKVKMGQEESWKAAVKDYAAVVKKAGSDHGFTVWESQSGPAQHAVVWYSSKWKEMDEQDPKLKPVEADIARLFARLDTVTDSLETWIDEMQPDMMIRSKEVLPMVRVARTRVVSGKMDELKALFHDQIVPAVKKSGATDYGVAVARFGTPANEIHSYLGLNGWADLDGSIGVEKGMSAAEFKAFQAKLQPLIESTEWSMWKFQPELSYIPAAK
jgi:quinol monooxygenase YgiN